MLADCPVMDRARCIVVFPAFLELFEKKKTDNGDSFFGALPVGMNNLGYPRCFQMPVATGHCQWDSSQCESHQRICTTRLGFNFFHYENRPCALRERLKLSRLGCPLRPPYTTGSILFRAAAPSGKSRSNESKDLRNHHRRR